VMRVRSLAVPVLSNQHPAATAVCGEMRLPDYKPRMNTNREDSRVGTALRAVRYAAARPEVIALPSQQAQFVTGYPLPTARSPGIRLAGVRARSQRSGTRFPYTRIRMELDHIVYEYENVNENDYTITQAEPEQALRAPSAQQPPISNHSTGGTDRNVRATVCGS
jgi:hypothetical protein